MRNLTQAFFLTIFLLLSAYLKSQDQIDFSDPDKIMATRTSLSVEKLMWIEEYKDKLMVKSFYNNETLGKLPQYYVNVELIDKTIPFPFAELNEKKITVVYKMGKNKLKYFNGYVSSIVESNYNDEYTIYLKSWLEIINNNADCEVFEEDQTMPQILSKVFDRYDFADYEFRLTKEYPKEKYIIQYRETDHNFISRQLQHVGMMYHFEHYMDKHVLVITDANESLKKRKSNMDYKINNSKGSSYGSYGYPLKKPLDELEYMTFKSYGYFTSDYHLSDYTYYDVDKRNIRVSSKTKKAGSSFNLFVYDSPGEFNNEEGGRQLANIRLQELLMSKLPVVDGTSNNIFENSGDAVVINDPNDTTYNGSYIMKDASHSVNFKISPSCSSAEDYYTISTSFSLVPDSIDLVPIRFTPKPNIPGVQTAHVVNAEPDKLGRILIKFLWGKDEKASNEMWVHTSTSSYPKKGDWVVVSFDEGNPDRPIVTGVMLKK